MQKHVFYRFYKVIVWAVIIGLLVFTPGDEFKRVKINIPHFDKLVHFGLFCILGWFIAATPDYKKHQPKKYAMLLLAVCYAAAIEFIQHYFIYMRSGDAVDFIFDTLGLLFGAISIKWWPAKWLWILE
jgi:VanZ family protein